MKRFNFRLERLLALRKHKEREWEIALATITGRCVALQREIDDMAKRKAFAFSHKYRRGLSDLDYVRATALYMQRLDATTKRKQEELIQTSLEREGIQKKYLDASKDRKVLDKLKERRAREYYREAREEEVKSMDEINTSLFGNKERLAEGGRHGW